MEVRIKMLKNQGWEEAATIDSCGQGHWVGTLTHKDHPGVIAVENCCDHRRAWLWSAESPESLHINEEKEEAE